MNAQIKDIAKELGVKTSDVESLMRMITTSFANDFSLRDFSKMSQEQFEDTLNAYITHEVKKFSDFCLSLLTNEEKKDAFNSYVISKLK